MTKYFLCSATEHDFSQIADGGEVSNSLTRRETKAYLFIFREKNF